MGVEFSQVENVGAGLVAAGDDGGREGSRNVVHDSAARPDCVGGEVLRDGDGAAFKDFRSATDDGGWGALEGREEEVKGRIAVGGDLNL